MSLNDEIGQKMLILRLHQDFHCTQPSQVDQVCLDSFCLAFFGLMTQQDFDNLWMSRLGFIETGIYVGCQDRDSSRLRNFLHVETKSSPLDCS